MQRFVVIGALLLSTLAVADTAAIVKQATPLLDTPSVDANSLGQLEGEEQVMVLGRQGGWYQVKPLMQEAGWLRLFHLQFVQERYQPDNLPIRELSGLIWGRHQQVTSSTGVRGLDKVAIVNAQPDYEQLAQLQQYQQSAREAQTFAKQALLKTNPQIPLKELE